MVTHFRWYRKVKFSISEAWKLRDGSAERLKFGYVIPYLHPINMQTCSLDITTMYVVTLHMPTVYKEVVISIR